MEVNIWDVVDGTGAAAAAVDGIAGTGAAVAAAVGTGDGAAGVNSNN